jgi:cell division protein FtsW
VNRNRHNLVSILLFLLAFGLLVLNSASLAVAEYQYGDSSYFLFSQSIRIILGLGLMVVISQIDYHRYHVIAKPFLLISIVLLLILVLPFTTPIAPIIRHVRRWIIYPFTFQPSELAKLALVLWCALTIQKKGPKIKEFKEGILPIFCVITLVMFLIVLEPDLSTAILCFSVVMVTLFLGGAKIRHLAAVCSIFCICFLIVAYFKGYAYDRILAILNPGQGLLEENYHYNQGMITLGSGGLVGRGIGNGMQKYFFLPEPHTDSIFSVIGEELGFVGTVGILSLFFLLGYYGYRIMMKCNDILGFILVGGILATIFIPVLLSVAINLGLLPGAGVGLPLISYGGSSMVTLLAGLGIVLNVAKHSETRRRKLERRR